MINDFKNPPPEYRIAPDRLFAHSGSARPTPRRAVRAPGTQVRSRGGSPSEQESIDQVFASFLDIAAQATSGDHLSTGPDTAYSTVFWKLVSSCAHTSGQVRAQSKLRPGDDGQRTLAELKRMVDWQASLGINRFVISPDVPLRQMAHWPHYTLFSDYAARLSYVLSQGRHKAQAAVLYPTMAAKTEHEPCAGLIRRLMMSYFALYCACLPLDHVDLDAVSEQHLRGAEVIDERLSIADANYELLIIPPTTCLGHAASERIRDFVEDGGKLIASVLLPTADSEGDKDEAVNNIFGELFHRDPAALSRRFLADQTTMNPHATQSESGAYLVQSAAPTDILDHLRDFVSAAIHPDVSIRLRGKECRDIICTRRTLDHEDVFFLTNNAATAREVQISLRCDGAPHVLDLETGLAAALPNCTQRGGRTLLLRRMEARESLLIYFNDEPALVVAPRRPTEGRPIPKFRSVGISGWPARGDRRVCADCRNPADSSKRARLRARGKTRGPGGVHRERGRRRRARMASVRTRHHKPDIARPKHHHAQNHEQPRG